MSDAISRIEQRLSELGVKKSKMLQDLDIPSSTYSTWKKKSAYPDSKYIIPISRYLAVSIDYIFTGEINGTWETTLKEEITTINVLGRVAAGVPIEAMEDIIGEETISKKMAETGEYFGLRISGDSMEPRMFSGDVVIVRQQSDVESGQTAIVMVNGDEATCKKIEKHDNGIMLVPLNKKYQERFYTNEDIEKLPVRILGRVVEVRGRL